MANNPHDKREDTDDDYDLVCPFCGNGFQEYDISWCDRCDIAGCCDCIEHDASRDTDLCPKCKNEAEKGGEA